MRLLFKTLFVRYPKPTNGGTAMASSTNIRVLKSDHVKDGEPLMFLSKKDYEAFQTDPAAWGHSIGEIMLADEEIEQKKCEDPKCLSCYDGELAFAYFAEFL